MKATLENPAKEKISTAKSAITLNHFKHSLRVVRVAIQRNSTIPILQGVRIEQLSSGLAIEGTNLDVSIRAMVPESNGPADPLVIPAEKLSAWVNLLSSDDDVKISATAARATLQCGRARAVLPIIPAKIWPDTASTFDLKAEGISLRQGDLARALRFAMIAVSYEESRYTLNGVLFDGDGEMLRIVATDGHRLMVYSLPCTEKIQLLVSARMIKAALPLLADEDEGIDLTHNDKTILASIASETPIFISAPRMTGTFPQYKALIPTGKQTTATLNAKELLVSLERCALLADDRSGLVVLNFSEKQLTMKAVSAENGEAEEIVDCTAAPKVEFKIGINVDYMIDLVKKLDGEIEIYLPENNSSPLLFKATPHDGEALSYIIMPMRT